MLCRSIDVDLSHNFPSCSLMEDWSSWPCHPGILEVLKLNSEGQEMWNMSLPIKNNGQYKDNKIMKS